LSFLGRREFGLPCGFFVSFPLRLRGFLGCPGFGLGLRSRCSLLGRGSFLGGDALLLLALCC